jgi:gag-polypeptide of LTR copia-type/Domain of unknown function (DUF4219)
MTDDGAEKSGLRQEEKLSESNWMTWSMRMEGLLDGKGLWDVIAANDNDKDKVRLARSWLIRSVGDGFLDVVSRKHPKQAWQELATGFGALAASRVAVLELQLQQCKKARTESLFSYCNRVRQLVSEIQLVDSKGAHTAVMSLLRGLPEEYRPTVLHLQLKQPLPSLAECQAALLLAEQTMLTADSVEGAALYGKHQQHQQGKRSGDQWQQQRLRYQQEQYQQRQGSPRYQQDLGSPRYPQCQENPRYQQ